MDLKARFALVRTKIAYLANCFSSYNDKIIFMKKTIELIVLIKIIFPSNNLTEVLSVGEVVFCSKYIVFSPLLDRLRVEFLPRRKYSVICPTNFLPRALYTSPLPCNYTPCEQKPYLIYCYSIPPLVCF